MGFLYHDDEVFTTAFTGYQHEPLTDREETNRIIVQIELLGMRIRAMVDTGGVYLLCSPELASLLDFDRQPSLEEMVMRVPRLGRVRGTLYRVPVTVLPEAGAVRPFEVTAFVPSGPGPMDGEPWAILGYHCCLEWLRFAVDPFEDRFYFGAPEVWMAEG
jgi:hypothetical protein